jgi:hypothetical protein
MRSRRRRLEDTCLNTIQLYYTIIGFSFPLQNLKHHEICSGFNYDRLFLHNQRATHIPSIRTHQSIQPNTNASNKKTISSSTGLMIYLLVCLLWQVVLTTIAISVHGMIVQKTRSSSPSLKHAPDMLETSTESSMNAVFPWLEVTTRLLRVDRQDQNVSGDALFASLANNLNHSLPDGYSHFPQYFPRNCSVEKGVMFVSPPGEPGTDVGMMIDVPDCDLVALELLETYALIPPTFYPETNVDSLIHCCLTQYLLSAMILDSKSHMSISETSNQSSRSTSRSRQVTGIDRRVRNQSPLLREIILIEDPSTTKCRSDVAISDSCTIDRQIIVHTLFRQVRPPYYPKDDVLLRTTVVRTGRVKWYDTGSMYGAILPDNDDDREILFRSDKNVKDGYSSGDRVAFRTRWTKSCHTNVVHRQAAIENNVASSLLED